MKVIIGCDPLLQPLSGIGHYTKNLAQGLISSPEVDNLNLFAHGKFFDNNLIDESTNSCVNITGPNETSNLNKKQLLGELRKRLATSQFAVKAYSMTIPFLEKVALRHYQTYIYHSPNFILPNFDGKKVVTIHDLSTLRYPDFHPKARVSYVNSLLENSINKSDHIITDSQFVKNEILNFFPIAPEKISVIHLGADSSFRPREKDKCLRIKKYALNYKQFFLFVSTIEPRKNLENLLLAFSLYRDKNPKGLPLILVGGDGWNNQTIRVLIDKFSAKGWVRHIGYVNQDDLPLLYSSALALLFPSIYEGFGLPVLEAMQSGTPVLTCSNSAMSEITQEYAALVEPESIENISAAIERLSNDDEWVSLLSESSIKRAKLFSWQKCVKETLSVYQKLI